MNIDIRKISQVIIRDKEGKILVAIKPSMLSLNTMMDKTKQLVITESKN